MAEENKSGTNYENFDSLKEKLVAVTSEIDAIKSSFAKGAEDLSRIQNMLSVGGIEDIGGVIEKYETRIADADRQRIEAAESSKKYSEELEKEKERLIKLWDAYKNQEEELSNTEKKIMEYEERAKTAEATQKQMENDYSGRIKTLEQKVTENEEKSAHYDEYKQRCKEFDGIRNSLEQEVHTLREEINRKQDEINTLNEQVSELRKMENYEEYKQKFEEVNAEYEKEKERLTKLYQLYEETDNECKRLKEENHNWQNWYKQKIDAFNQLSTGAPTLVMPTAPDKSIDDPTKKKKKKKIKLKNK